MGGFSLAGGLAAKLAAARAAAAQAADQAARAAAREEAESQNQHLAHNQHLARLPGGHALSQQPAVQPAALVLKMEP